MTCEQFDEALGSYFEGELDPRSRAAAEAHRGECLRCAALVRDMEAIRSEAANLPELTPSRDLWAGIVTRIEAPIIRIAPRGSVGGGVARHLRTAAAAAILIAVTSGITYVLTVQRAGGDALRTGGSGAAAAPNGEPGGFAVVRPDSSRSSGLGQGATPVRDVPAVVTYDREIAALRGVLDLRRDDLDPATVAILSNSLVTIDRAIAEARAAVARDSASAFLNDQLHKALEKKLGLLRTVALLPPRA
jgi:hypothetical protein